VYACGFVTRTAAGGEGDSALCAGISPERTKNQLFSWIAVADNPEIPAAYSISMMTRAVPTSKPTVKSKLLASLDDDALRHILGAAQVRQIAANKNVIVSGESPNHLYLLRAGRVKFYNLTESGTEVLLLWKVPGDIVGLVSLLANPPAYMASAKTVSECEFLVWDHATIRRLAKAYPLLTENGLRLALYYLSVYMNRHAGIMTKTAESRLAEVLLRLATSAGEVHPAGVEIDITNEQLSSLSDISPFTASRLLSKWERDGKVSKGRGRVTLRSPESLMIA
jgi:CRP/FNR family transcriptional regulator, nitrogen oxide reductase regulator